MSPAFKSARRWAKMARAILVNAPGSRLPLASVRTGHHVSAFHRAEHRQERQARSELPISTFLNAEWPGRVEAVRALSDQLNEKRIL